MEQSIVETRQISKNTEENIRLDDQSFLNSGEEINQKSAHLVAEFIMQRMLKLL